jgi:hypothetical protein
MSDDNEWQDGHQRDDWSEAQADLYGRVFRFLLNNQKNVTHPNTTPMNGREWRTLAHNVAHIAADLLEGEFQLHEGEVLIADSAETSTLN